MYTRDAQIRSSSNVDYVIIFLVNLYLGLFVQFDRTAEALTGKEGGGDTRHSNQPSELNSGHCYCKPNQVSHRGTPQYHYLWLQSACWQFTYCSFFCKAE